MATIPLFFRGKDLASVILYPQTIGTAGVLADASTKTLTTQVDSIQVNLTSNNENINAVNQPRGNHMIIEDDYSFSVSMNEVHNASDPDPTLTTFLTNDVFKLVFVKGTQAGSIRTWTLYGVRAGHTSGVTGKGGQKSTIEFAAVDTGSTSYVSAVVS